ncbi:GNAT family N-acetyltransferase [Ornithinimicrobium pratense]|uniref:GNAT family N-acetyltransferase n=1 Tax=Ornithinimicrobium pratense TaxID=2593973 RepID=A0A5J6V605_9MICO|nr:GNAT family N-acetyltransferase [Ornithinimicrobium pratense]QFG68601.1 GNAT family N-acetyltransferase [Ornithinimicrobium pratense]
MTDYRWAPVSHADLEPWATLVNHLAKVDGTGEFSSVENLAEELDSSHRDPQRDTWAVWDGDRMVADAAVSVPPTPDYEGRARCSVSGGVHPDHRGRGLGSRLLALCEARGRELLAERHPGREAYFSADGQLAGSSARELLTDHGYAVVRHFNHLRRDLDDVADLPPGPAYDDIELLSPGPGHEGATRVAHEQAFTDHWGSGPVAPGPWHERWVSRSARAELSTIAVARGGEHDGQVVAYVLVGQWVDREAYVNLVGTVAAFRGRGLAAACLRRTIGLSAASGDYDVIDLDVDSTSPTGATRLYERLGFHQLRQTAAMRRPVKASA